MKFERELVEELQQGLEKAPGVMHVVVGPRQVGKSTAVRQLAQKLTMPVHVASADSPVPLGAQWIENHWQLAEGDTARLGGAVLLVLDEVQKISGWSEVVKRCWDESRASGSQLRVILLGSSALLVQAGLTESLAGRFFLHRATHWSWPECQKAFGWSLEEWFYFGGYPGAAAFVDNESNWRRYIADSMVETALARDVMQMSTISKPILLRHLFGTAVQFPAQIVSYNKITNLLSEAGNATTVAHYLRLLGSAFLVSGLEQYSAGQVRRRGSSPKLVVWNNALINSLSGRTHEESRKDAPWWGRVVENAVGAHLLNELQGTEWSVTYWRDGDKEVDFVVSRGRRVWGIEVKSGRAGKLSGMEAFKRRYPDAGVWVIGSGGIAFEEFFKRKAVEFFC